MQCSVLMLDIISQLKIREVIKHLYF